MPLPQQAVRLIVRRLWASLRSNADPRIGPVRGRSHVGPNKPCPCGSGRKFKKCHVRLEGRKR